MPPTNRGKRTASKQIGQNRVKAQQQQQHAGAIDQTRLNTAIETLREYVPLMHRDRNLKNRIPEAVTGFPQMFRQWSGFALKNYQHVGQAQQAPAGLQRGKKATAKGTRGVKTMTPQLVAS